MRWFPNVARTILMATQVQLYRFDNVLAKGQMQGDFGTVYAPHQTWITGDIDIHDVGMPSAVKPFRMATRTWNSAT